MSLEELVPKLLTDRYEEAVSIIARLLDRVEEWNLKGFTIGDDNLRRFYFTFLLQDIHIVKRLLDERIIDSQKIDYLALSIGNRYSKLRARIEEETTEVVTHLRGKDLLNVERANNIKGEDVNVYQVTPIYRQYKPLIKKLLQER